MNLPTITHVDIYTVSHTTIENCNGNLSFMDLFGNNIDVKYM